MFRSISSGMVVIAFGSIRSRALVPLFAFASPEARAWGACIVTKVRSGLMGLALASLVVAFSAAAFAEGRPRWTGFYVGANAGYAWGDSDSSSSATCGTVPPVYFQCANQGVVQASGTGTQSPDGFTGGVQAGYNLQNGGLVYGAEIDFGAFNLSGLRVGNSIYSTAAIPFTTTASIDTDWLATARGRLGWTATPNLLIYATGGLALTTIKVANSFRDAVGGGPAFGADSNSDLKVGWTIGGGAEWMLTRNWTVKAEYLYVDFGHVSASANVTDGLLPPANSLLTTSSDLTAQIMRVGINYRF
jgi:outer membrane immunogenic protein